MKLNRNIEYQDNKGCHVQESYLTRFNSDITDILTSPEDQEPFDPAELEEPTELDESIDPDLFQEDYDGIHGGIYRAERIMEKQRGIARAEEDIGDIYEPDYEGSEGITHEYNPWKLEENEEEQTEEAATEDERDNVRISPTDKEGQEPSDEEQSDEEIQPAD